MAQRRKSALVVLILLALGAQLAFAQLAGAAVGEWTPEIARQLVAEGWEYAAQREFPAVLYGIQVVELRGYAAALVNMALGLSLSQAEGSQWRVTVSPEVLQFAADNFLDASIAGEDAGDISSFHNTAWLGTILDKPVSISLSREEALAGPGEGFSLELVPLQLRTAAQEVLTRVALQWESREGNLAQLDSTAWVGFSKPYPLAVVSARQQDKKAAQNKHFAIFLRAAVLEPENLPTDMPFLQVGSIQSLSDLFAEIWQEEKSRPPKQVAYLGLSSDGEQFGYRGQYSILLPEGIGFTVLAAGDLDTGFPTVYLGMVDELEWSRQLRFRAYLLPIGWNRDEGFQLGVGRGWELDYSLRSNWQVKIGGEYLSAQWRHFTAVAYSPTEKISWELGVSLEDQDYSVRTGIALKL